VRQKKAGGELIRLSEWFVCAPETHAACPHNAQYKSPMPLLVPRAATVPEFSRAAMRFARVRASNGLSGVVLSAA